MFDDEDNIGVCLISGEKAEMYIVTISGSHYNSSLTNTIDVHLTNKHNKGGQSSVRFGRIADKIRENYTTLIANSIISTYMFDNKTKCNIKKLILAGPGPMKIDVSNTDIFIQYMNKYLFKIINVNNFNDTTASHIVSEIISDIRADNIKEIDKEISELVSREYDKLAFGINECINLLENNNIIKLYVNKSLLDNNTKDKLISYRNSCSVLIIFTESENLKMYGGWICIKKYYNDQISPEHDDQINNENENKTENINYDDLF